ncbi:amino acid ABC transporter permease [Facklamia sp. DSM 111018]|uniref:Amino acid ABC transporter permease n=1 Tax=Facklamia lactis TaxID=2749967 RepID=A0ABS0LND9_9LACT|nr:amino acid ABC transporter permease [Facklamia lactis]MBG9979657.1 amino acid ABC transporter permease [Facklamia lactis]MBG9985663.1 amino acid ABC transporter permease [Facklamia lactis]
MDLARMLPPLLEGLQTTMLFFAWTLVLSIPLGLVISLIDYFSPKVLQLLIRMYIVVFRGTPLLLQMMFVYYGLPLVGINFDRFNAALVTLILNYAAYYAEIYRGGLQSIPQGQYEALQVLSIHPWLGLRKVIIPQVHRTILPSLGNEIISLIKDTSLIYVLGLEELLKVGRTLSNQTASLIPFVYVGFLYLGMTAVATWGLRLIEKRVDYTRSKEG